MSRASSISPTQNNLTSSNTAARFVGIVSCSFYLICFNTALRARTGHSEQFYFFKNDRIVRKDEELPKNPMVEMYATWKKKAPVTEIQSDLKNTHTNLFTSMPQKRDENRVQRLIQGELKGRRDNPVTGYVHFLTKD